MDHRRFVRQLGMTPLQLVLAGTAVELAYFLFEIPTGVVADLGSRRLSLAVAAAVSGVAMLVVRAAGQVPIVLAGMALWGIGWTFRSGAQDAWLADQVGREGLGVAYQRGAQVGRLTGLLGIAVAVALALVDLRLPFLAAGSTALALAGYIVGAMPETPSVRPARATVSRPFGTMVRTVAEGARVVRATPVLLLMLGVLLFLGAFEEGFDRLWEAHLLLDVGLPALGGGLGDLAWFGILAAATLVLSFAISAPLVRRIERLDPLGLARLLLVLQAVLVVCSLGFGLSGSILPAVATYLGTTVVRDLTGPAMQTWLTGSVAESSVRATVLSLSKVSGSLGEWTGGPVLGFVGTRWTVRTALAVASLLVAPVLVLLGRALRHHGREPELVGVGDGDGARRRPPGKVA